jgi:hypothetical protein
MRATGSETRTALLTASPCGIGKVITQSPQTPMTAYGTFLPFHVTPWVFLLLEHISKFDWIPEPNLPKCEPFHTRRVNTGSSVFC